MGPIVLLGDKRWAVEGIRARNKIRIMDGFGIL